MYDFTSVKRQKVNSRIFGEKSCWKNTWCARHRLPAYFLSLKYVALHDYKLFQASSAKAIATDRCAYIRTFLCTIFQGHSTNNNQIHMHVIMSYYYTLKCQSNFCITIDYTVPRTPGALPPGFTRGNPGVHVQAFY